MGGNAFTLCSLLLGYSVCRWHGLRFCASVTRTGALSVGVGIAKPAEEGQADVRSSQRPDIVRSVTAPFSLAPKRQSRFKSPERKEHAICPPTE